jgi:hypothetical protein
MSSKIKTVSLSFLQERSLQQQNVELETVDDEDDEEIIIQALPTILQERLFDHQRSGVNWLHRKV